MVSIDPNIANLKLATQIFESNLPGEKLVLTSSNTGVFLGQKISQMLNCPLADFSEISKLKLIGKTIILADNDRIPVSQTQLLWQEDPAMLVVAVPTITLENLNILKTQVDQVIFLETLAV